jgi:glycosyltransferase involved in cell wall biosynthesis
LKQMNICFIGKFYWPAFGGGEIYIHNVLRYLATKNHRCTAICFTDGLTNQQFPQSKHVMVDGVRVFQSACLSPPNVLNLIRMGHYDVVITQSTGSDLFMAAAKFSGTKTVFGVHFYSEIISMNDGGFFRDVLDDSNERITVQKKRHRVFHEANAFFVNSDFMVKILEKYVGKTPTSVIYPPINPDFLITRWDPKYITYVNPCVGKGMGVFHDIAQKMPDHEFMIVGAFVDTTPDNVAIYESLQKMPNVKVAGDTTNMAKVYSRTKILLVPSLVDETFSMVTLEACLNGIPVIASPRGNLPFLVDEGLGYIVPETDIDEWVKRINELVEQNRYATFVSAETKERFRAKYDPQTQCEKFEKLLELVAASGGVGSASMTSSVED